MQLSCYFFKKIIQIFEYYSKHISRSSSNSERSLMIFKLNRNLDMIHYLIVIDDLLMTLITILSRLQLIYVNYRRNIMKTLRRLNLYNSLHYIFLFVKHCNFCVIVERCKWRNHTWNLHTFKIPESLYLYILLGKIKSLDNFSFLNNGKKYRNKNKIYRSISHRQRYISFNLAIRRTFVPMATYSSLNAFLT